jgi:hypothetical protein
LASQSKVLNGQGMMAAKQESHEAKQTQDESWHRFDYSRLNRPPARSGSGFGERQVPASIHIQVLVQAKPAKRIKKRSASKSSHTHI